VASPNLTLGDLLAMPEFDLTLVCGRDALTRPVAGAHTVDVEAPARWLDRQWIMLTSGLGISRKRAGQRALIAELDDAGVSALGLGLGTVFDTVPAGLVREARERDFPIFSIPLTTAFRDISAAVFRAALSREIRASNRLAAMQRFLLEALGDDSPRVTAVQRLAALIDSTVAVLRPDGTVETATSELPGEEIAEQIRARPAAVVHFATSTVHGAALPVGNAGSARGRWLVTAVPLERAKHALAISASQATVPLLLAMDRLDRARRVQELGVARATLLAALETPDARDAPILAARLLACDLDVAQGATVVAIQPAAPTDAEALLDELGRWMDDNAGVPFLGAVRDGRVAGLLPSAAGVEALDAWSAGRGAGAGAFAGVAPPIDDAMAIAPSWSAALVALKTAIRTAKPILRYDDLTLPSVLLNEVPLERLTPKVAAWLEPLDGNPRIRDTLQSYLDHGLDVRATARALHLHPNSVRYRLGRAEELLDAPLRSPETIVALHVALRSPQ
jgi:purine catabolism regulator